MPLSDSSMTCMRAVRPWPSPAVLPTICAAGVFEVSRFSCMKFLGVHWGLRLRRTDQRLAISPLLMLPSAHINCVGVLIASFRSSIPSPPIPLFTLRCAPRGGTTQNSGPSGSLLLSRRDSSSPTSYRFIPAHCNGLFSSSDNPSSSYRLERAQSCALADLSGVISPKPVSGQPQCCRPQIHNHWSAFPRSSFLDDKWPLPFCARKVYVF